MEEKYIILREEIDKYIDENIVDIIFDKFTDFLDNIDEYEYDEISLMKEEIDKWMKKIEILKINPKKCPKCGADEVLKIEYGEPLPEFYNAPGLYFAGCCVEDYKWHCKKCRWEWGKKIEGRYCEDDIDDDEDNDNNKE
jgi:hypothetical protein